MKNHTRPRQSRVPSLSGGLLLVAGFGAFLVLSGCLRGVSPTSPVIPPEPTPTPTPLPTATPTPNPNPTPTPPPGTTPTPTPKPTPTPTPTPAPAPKLSKLQSSYISSRCASGGCHGGPFPALGLSLETGKTWGATVNVAAQQGGMPLVAPFNPDGSYLVRKMQGSGGISGSPMPTGKPCTQQQIDDMRAWIAAGALNN